MPRRRLLQARSPSRPSAHPLWIRCRLPRPPRPVLQPTSHLPAMTIDRLREPPASMAFTCWTVRTFEWWAGSARNWDKARLFAVACRASGRVHKVWATGLALSALMSSHQSAFIDSRHAANWDEVHLCPVTCRPGSARPFATAAGNWDEVGLATVARVDSSSHRDRLVFHASGKQLGRSELIASCAHPSPAPNCAPRTAFIAGQLGRSALMSSCPRSRSGLISARFSNL